MVVEIKMYPSFSSSCLAFHLKLSWKLTSIISIVKFSICYESGRNITGFWMPSKAPRLQNAIGMSLSEFLLVLCEAFFAYWSWQTFFFQLVPFFVRNLSWEILVKVRHKINWNKFNLITPVINCSIFSILLHKYMQYLHMIVTLRTLRAHILAQTDVTIGAGLY